MITNTVRGSHDRYSVAVAVASAHRPIFIVIQIAFLTLINYKPNYPGIGASDDGGKD